MRAPERHLRARESSPAAAIVVSALLAFNLFVVGPYTVYAGNVGEYSAPISSVFLHLAGAALVSTLALAAILLLASLAMWVAGMLLARQVVKVLRIPPQIFMPIIGVLCMIGSYALGINVFNLYLMLPVGIVSYFLIEMGYPIAPLVIGVILGPMADENLRRALMVSQGSFLPIFTRPVSLILFLIILWTLISQIAFFKNLKNRLLAKILPRRFRQGPTAKPE